MIPADPGRIPARCGVAIVGAGITGLSSAHRLLEAGAVPAGEVVVLEAAERLGGQIRTLQDGPYLLEAGADTLVTQKPAGLALCRRLGLGEELIRPYAGGATVHVVRGGKLFPVPDGFMLVGPTRLAPLLASRLFSPAGKLRMIAERFLPPASAEAADESLRSFVTRRFGRESFERVAEPVVGGLFTADSDRLSMQMNLSRFLDLERRSGSVWRGLAAARSRRESGGDAADPVALRRGMQTLVERLAERLAAATLFTGARVTLLAPAPAGAWRVTVHGVGSVVAHAVVLACPAFVAAELLREVDPALAAGLGDLEYASCATVNLVYDRAAVLAPPAGFGFFVPRTEGVPVLACSHVSRKFEGRAPADHVVLRVYLGGALHGDVLDLGDRELVETAHAYLAPLLRLGQPPRLARVHRHARAMPQLSVGDLERVRALEQRSARHDGLFLCGGGLGAIGIPDCIRSGEGAAEQAREYLARPARVGVAAFSRPLGCGHGVGRAL